jgi:hypothetical protein
MCLLKILRIDSPLTPLWRPRDFPLVNPVLDGGLVGMEDAHRKRGWAALTPPIHRENSATAGAQAAVGGSGVGMGSGGGMRKIGALKRDTLY